MAGLEAAKRAEDVAKGLGELAQRRARLWVTGIRVYTDPTFVISEARAETESDVQAFEAAGDVDALLEAYVVLNFIDTDLAHWQASATSARIAIAIATEAGLEGRREEFVDMYANALVWGSSDASESLTIIDGFMASTSRRLRRAGMLSGAAILRAMIGDRDGAEAAQAGGDLDLRHAGISSQRLETGVHAPRAR